MNTVNWHTTSTGAFVTTVEFTPIHMATLQLADIELDQVSELVVEVTVDGQVTACYDATPYQRASSDVWTTVDPDNRVVGQWHSKFSEDEDKVNPLVTSMYTRTLHQLMPVIRYAVREQLRRCRLRRVKAHAAIS